MRILITGGAGFVGGNLATYFAIRDHEIFCIDNLSRRGSEKNLEIFRNFKNIQFMHCDIRCPEDFLNINFNPDIVLECSAQTTAIDGYRNPVYDFTNNTQGAFNVLEYCRQKQAGLIFWSSNKAYSGHFCNSIPMKELKTRFEWDLSIAKETRGWSKLGFNEEGDVNGTNHTVYGATKNAADLICQEWSNAFDIPILVNRFSCLYGKNQFGKVGQGWIVWFAIAKKLKLPLYYYGYDGKQVRDCLHIDDVCSLIDNQIDKISTNSGNYYNVGGGIDNTMSVRELNNKLNLMMGINHDLETKLPRAADQKIYISDITKVSNDFDWKPTINIEKGLTDILEWINKDTLEWVEK